MTDIPEGLVEAVARVICAEEDGNPDALVKYHDMYGGGLMQRWRQHVVPARAAILAQNAWQDDLNRRMVEFVEFRGENPRG